MEREQTRRVELQQRRDAIIWRQLQPTNATTSTRTIHGQTRRGARRA
jgi:hypothetical protein